MKKRDIICRSFAVAVAVALLSVLVTGPSIARVPSQGDPATDGVVTEASVAQEPQDGSQRSAQGDIDASTLAPQAGEATSEVINGDLTVHSSLCVGLECLESENFGADTIRLKEQNLRIHFDDTSPAGAFPGNDWRVTINDKTNGGESYFSVDDVSAGRTPVRIDAGAANDALRIAPGGYSRIGINEEDPVRPLHIRYANTPSIRLEQTDTEGWSPQTWDICAHEAWFHVRDITHNSAIPFAISTGAPDWSFKMAGDGDVALGTRHPHYPLHVVRNDVDAALGLERTGGATAVISAKDDSVQVGSVTTHTVALMVDAEPVFLLDANGNVTIDGLLTEASDRALKENFRPVDGGDVLERLAGLPISTWNFIADGDDVEHMGPVAQDFFAAFGLGADDEHIAPMDANGVALAGVHELHQMVLERDAQIAELERENAELEERLADLEALVETLIEAQGSSAGE